MKVALADGRLVKIGVKIGDEQPVLNRPLPPEAQGKRFRSLQIKLTVFQGETEIGHVTGVSYCSPLDQFERLEGRKHATKRLLANAHAILSKQERAFLAPILLNRSDINTKKRVKK
jgi:hypothetical protein